MNKYKHIYILFIVVLFAQLVSFDVFGQIGTNVYNDRVYSYLDKLASEKLIKRYSPNQKPLSRYAVAKLVIEAKGRVSSNRKSFVTTIIDELENKFKDEIAYLTGEEKEVLDFIPLDKVHLTYVATSQPEYEMPANGLGSTGGKVQPLFAYSDGRHYRGYSNFYFDFSSRLQATPYFAAYYQPEFYHVSGDDFKGGVKTYRGYLKAGYKNFEFQIGRDNLIWGPGENSLFFSKNVRPMDMIRLSSPSTFRFPWIFKYLGQWRTTAFFSWLGTKYSQANAILSGYRIDWQPVYWLDLGLDHAVVMGGRGARDPSVKVAVGEFVGFIFKSGNSHASSDHQFGLDLTTRVVPLYGMELYGKWLVEDYNSELGLLLKHDSSWLGGIHFPRVGKNGRASIRAEFVKMGEFAYRHSVFYDDGYSLSNKFFGNDAGSDTYSGELSGKYIFNLDEFIFANVRYLWRSSNVYQPIWQDPNGMIGIRKIRNGPKEQHYILKVGGQKALSRKINVFGELGLDYTQNKYFQASKDALDFGLQLKFTLHNL